MKSREFTLIELLVVMTIIVILAGVLLPSLSFMKEKAKISACANNQMQIYRSVALYASDWHDWMPMKYHVKKKTLSSKESAEGKKLNSLDEGMQTLLFDYAKSYKIFQDPADKGAAENKTPIWQQCGTSYDLKGWELKDLREKDKGKQSEKILFWGKKNWNEHIVSDIFPPWDSDDPAKVASKIEKGERGPTKFHGKKMVRTLGNGAVIFPKSKEEDERMRGKIEDE